MSGDLLAKQRFGRLVVLWSLGRKRPNPDQRSREIYKCQCDCGGVVDVEHYQLTRGKTKSCGCLRRELSSERRRQRKEKTYA
jgi:hypothetical protein